MLASALIEKLQEIMQSRGDIEVMFADPEQWAADDPELIVWVNDDHVCIGV